MKKLFLIAVLGTVLGCNAQQKLDLSSSDIKMNYIFSRMYNEKPIHQNLFNQSLYLSIYKFSDSKISKGINISESEEFLSSYMISVTPDGDSYSTSKLYKIEGVLNPEIIKIKEENYPFFTIKIEHGLKNSRKIETFHFKGN
ncbi:hypothetical protein ACSIGC_12460 [Tenacibaculum sp. ZS6-P6]|uniref:hypothetical protein n=1 Tax=Tenacibaculum sp. ZS6-P6 TaxID=3447503 RepID=UPI003F992F49